ncbi:MAG: glycoside hydrolase family 3 C-terminal domain-containing protein [Prevotellaceae bacterium]|jgi:beta-glucosidase|nr:glycoside hydrolase family 3 C-terminal domain-containing protein [Prevotellaceae bacterium]
MKKSVFTMLIIATLAACSQKADLYKDASQPVEKRVENLLSQMNLEEKVGQMNQFVGLEHMKAALGNLTEEELYNNTANAFYPNTSVADVENWTKQGLIGSFLHVLTIEEANYLQSLAMESRLQIPIIFGIDAIHGNANCPDNTVYATNINLACSFDTAMAYTIARQTAAEMRAMNMHWTFNPNVEVARDARWGRVGETYGEDPYLVGLMGVKSVEGYQGNLNSANDVLACIKHFVGGSQPANGTNGSPTDISERTLREVFFPPFKLGVDAGAMSLMTAHNELNGVPCHENDYLMNEVLRKEWGFKGFVVSDWMDIEHIFDVHATAENLKEAFYQSITAGMDMHMHGIKWNELVCELVREGRISEKRIDESVRRILTVKFQLGLFEQPFADVENSMKIRLNDEHRQTALESARNGIVLLKNSSFPVIAAKAAISSKQEIAGQARNDTPLLPLDFSKYKKVLVTGINADDENILGDWSAQQKPENVITVLEGLKMISPETNFDFVNQGWDPRNMDKAQVELAAQKAKSADLNIVVAGEYMMRYRWTERTDGEDTDRSDLDLVGLQNELIQKVAASGKPTILILISGRPLGVEWAADNLPAIVEAFAPGMYGGQAIAEILAGKINPSAKLAITIPRSVGQLQMVYNHKPSMYFHPYAAYKSSEPLFPFGFGLSYTNYEYSDLKIEPRAKSQEPRQAKPDYKVSVKIKNTGNFDGVEIVQLYIRDKFSSVTRPVKELKDFARVPLKAGEEKTVEFTVTPDKLAFYDKNMNWVVEKGEFEIMVGKSSKNEDLLKATIVVE